MGGQGRWIIWEAGWSFACPDDEMMMDGKRKRKWKGRGVERTVI